MERSDVVRLLGSLGQRKLLSFSLVLFTLATGIVIGTLISTGVDAARKDAVAPDAKPLTIPHGCYNSSNITSFMLLQFNHLSDCRAELNDLLSGGLNLLQPSRLKSFYPHCRVFQLNCSVRKF